MKCSELGCSGEYEQKLTTQVLERKGKIVIIEDIPSLVCDVCGDTCVDPEVFGQLVKIGVSGEKPVRFAPVFQYTVDRPKHVRGRRGPTISNQTEHEAGRPMCAGREGVPHEPRLMHRNGSRMSGRNRRTQWACPVCGRKTVIGGPGPGRPPGWSL